MGKKAKKKTGTSSRRSRERPVAEHVETAETARKGHDLYGRPWVVGDRVCLSGLTTDHYNGKYGKTVSLKVKNAEDRIGVLVEGDTAAKAFRPDNLRHLEGDTPSTTTEEKRAIRDAFENMKTPTEQESANADQLSLIRFMKSRMSAEQQIKVFGRTLVPMPAFHQELMKYKSFRQIKHVNHTWAAQYLRLSFEQASGLPENFEMAFRSETYEPGPKDMFKRLNNADPNKIKWYLSSRSFGDVFQERRVAPYPDVIRHSFSNQEYQKERLERGKTHVGVGFVDLGVLLESDLHGPETEKLTFVGVELSAYAVAKTLVIWEMLKQTPKHPQEQEKHIRMIGQVWFSSTWTQGTGKVVKQVLAKLISSSPTHPQVNHLLRHWYNAPTTPLARARCEIQSSSYAAVSEIGQFRYKSDRVAFGLYEITRDFSLGTEEPTCSNMLMFDCPDGTAPLDTNESIFSCFPSHKLMDMLNSSDLASVNTIMDAAHEFAMQGLRRLSMWAVTEQVTVELICANISHIAENIAERQPCTMRWSNICDYMDYKDFHRLARSCSSHGNTIHHVPSMNWLSETWGVNVIDYRGPGNRDIRSYFLKDAQTAAEKIYKVLEWDTRLRLPPPINPINTATDFLLAEMGYENWT